MSDRRRTYGIGGLDNMEFVCITFTKTNDSIEIPSIVPTSEHYLVSFNYSDLITGTGIDGARSERAPSGSSTSSISVSIHGKSIYVNAILPYTEIFELKVYLAPVDVIYYYQ